VDGGRSTAIAATVDNYAYDHPYEGLAMAFEKVFVEMKMLYLGG